MKPLVIIYWSRLAMGILASLISALIATLSAEMSYTTFLNGLTVALFVYILSYYGFKAKFHNAVEKQSKIMSQGIGMFFISWAAFFVLFYSILTMNSL